MLTEILSRYLAEETEENQEEPQPRKMVSKARFKPSKFQVRINKFPLCHPPR
jgi:hypothetical protein